jgi:hypothetical protein
MGQSGHFCKAYRVANKIKLPTTVWPAFQTLKALIEMRKTCYKSASVFVAPEMAVSE